MAARHFRAAFKVFSGEKKEKLEAEREGESLISQETMAFVIRIMTSGIFATMTNSLLVESPSMAGHTHTSGPAIRLILIHLLAPQSLTVRFAAQL